MLKRLKILLACVLAIAMLLPCFVVTAEEEEGSVRNKRVVSIVYDDSKSMHGDNAAYTSYAIQAFTGLLNSDDALYITYMNNPDSAQTVDLTNPLNAVNDIRDYQGGKKTPIKSLNTAFNALKSHNDDNAFTQYWLVVLTDGKFDEDKEMKQTQKFVENVADATMPNGSKPHVQYMAIGEKSDSYCPKETRANISALTVKSSEEIVKNIFDISSSISGRYSINADDINAVEDDTVTVSSELPLINIGVLTQNTDAVVEKISTKEKKSVNIKNSVMIQSPQADNPCVEGASDSALGLEGNVTLAGEEAEILPAGEYKIKFNKKIKKENIVIMLEPELEIRVMLYSKGEVITDWSEITSLTPDVSARVGIYKIGTDTEVPADNLPAGIKYKFSYSIDGKIVESVDNAVIPAVNIKDGQNEFSATLELPGYFSLNTSETFKVSTIIVTDLKATLLPDGSKRKSDTDGPEVIYTERLRDNKTGIQFTAYNSGQPFTPQEAERKLGEFKSSISTKLKNCEVEILEDGSYLVYPKKPGYGQFIFSILYNGEQTISAELNEHSAEGSLIFKVDWFYFGIRIALILIAIYFLLWMFVKKRFCLTTVRTYLGEFYEEASESEEENAEDAEPEEEVYNPFEEKKEEDNRKIKFEAEATKKPAKLNFFTAKNILNFFSLAPAVKKVGIFTLKAGSPLLGLAGKKVWVVDLKGCGHSYIYHTPICSEYTSDVLLESKRDLYLQSKDHNYYKMTRKK